MERRRKLAVAAEDIFTQFAYAIGVRADESANRKWIEIYVVFHVLQNAAQLQQEVQEMPFSRMQEFTQKYEDRYQLCNYRFIREYNKDGPVTGWTINLLGHFCMDSKTSFKQM